MAKTRSGAGIQRITIPAWYGANGLLATSGGGRWFPLQVGGNWLHYQLDDDALGPLEFSFNGASVPPFVPTVNGSILGSKRANAGGLSKSEGVVLHPGSSLCLGKEPIGLCFVRAYRSRGDENLTYSAAGWEGFNAPPYAIPNINDVEGVSTTPSNFPGAPTILSGEPDAWVGEVAYQSEEIVLPGWYCHNGNAAAGANSTIYTAGQTGYVVQLEDITANWNNFYAGLGMYSLAAFLPAALRSVYGRAVWECDGLMTGTRVSLANQRVPRLGYSEGVNSFPFGGTNNGQRFHLVFAMPTTSNASRSQILQLPQFGAGFIFNGGARVSLRKGPSYLDWRALYARVNTDTLFSVASTGYNTVALPCGPMDAFNAKVYLTTNGAGFANQTLMAQLQTLTTDVLATNHNFNDPARGGGGTLGTVIPNLVSGQCSVFNQRGAQAIQIAVLPAGSIAGLRIDAEMRAEGFQL